ncbi:MAG: J domain-containing protein [Terracidiphilus sp.]|jgi:DnaJ-domain-containing protein 1
MEGQFQVDRGSCATTPEGYEATPGIDPNRKGRPWQFVDEFQQLLGDDSEPDIRFFVESWTSGTASAVENFQQRRQRKPGRELARQAFCESDIVDTQSFVQQRALHAELASSIASSAIAGSSDTADLPQSSEDPAAQSQEEAWREWDKFIGGSSQIHPITTEGARLLLGVTANSTRKQIKAAYRRMVSQWHPDRLELKTDEVRQLATERMAAINEAYHLLSDIR